MRQDRVVDLDVEIALSAAKLGLTHKLPFANSLILATVRKHQASIWTQDADFEGLDGVQCFAQSSYHKSRYRSDRQF